MVEILEELAEMAKTGKNIKSAIDAQVKIGQLKGLFKEDRDRQGIVEINTKKMTKNQITLTGLDEDKNVSRK